MGYYVWKKYFVLLFGTGTGTALSHTDSIMFYKYIASDHRITLHGVIQGLSARNFEVEIKESEI